MRIEELADAGQFRGWCEAECALVQQRIASLPMSNCTYRVTNLVYRITVDVPAYTAQEACKRCGWDFDECHIRREL